MSARRHLLAELTRLEPPRNAEPEEQRAFELAREQLLDALRRLPPERVDGLTWLVEAPGSSSRELLRRRDLLVRAQQRLGRSPQPARGSRLRRKG